MPQQNPRNTYLAVADTIRDKITKGEIAGMLLPKSALAVQFGVSLSTVNRALKTLREEGVVETRPGSGTYVAGTGDRRPTAERLADHILTFEPGDMLPGEDELARTIGVSRTALRPAIALLEGQGLLGRCGGRRLVVLAPRSRNTGEER